MSHKTVWITGASSGIGREFACRYAKLGFRLILTARRRERLDQLAAELLAKYNTFCRVLPADLARESECTRLCEELAEERIDIFINNAGFGVCGSFLETSTEAELLTLAAFFTILGDNLAMVATQRANLSSQQCQRQDSVNSSDSRCTEEEKRVEWDNNITTESGNSS